MAEPLSASASIIAVVGFAAESSKLIFSFFQGITHSPATIHDSALALSSLYVTLTNVQQSGTKLGPSYKFPAHFCGRINDCLKDLKTFEAKIDKIDAVFSNRGIRKHDWDTKTRRSWERVRWLLVGEQETRRFLDKVKILWFSQLKAGEAKIEIQNHQWISTIFDDFARAGSRNFYWGGVFFKSHPDTATISAIAVS
ncbi:MAG: hypothetical protein Q9192_004300 [Flavoplaca navasiana]